MIICEGFKNHLPAHKNIQKIRTKKMMMMKNKPPGTRKRQIKIIIMIIITLYRYNNYKGIG